MRSLKTATWASIALLVGAEIFARSPLSTPLKGGIDEVAILKERKGQSSGPAKELPGVRPFPSFYDLQLRPDPAAPPANPPAAPAAAPSAPSVPTPPTTPTTPAATAAPASPPAAAPAPAPPSAAQAAVAPSGGTPATP
jgi:hypothetical protein